MCDATYIFHKPAFVGWGSNKSDVAYALSPGTLRTARSYLSVSYAPVSLQDHGRAKATHKYDELILAVALRLKTHVRAGRDVEPIPVGVGRDAAARHSVPWQHGIPELGPAVPIREVHACGYEPRADAVRERTAAVDLTSVRQPMSAR